MDLIYELLTLITNADYDHLEMVFQYLHKNRIPYTINSDPVRIEFNLNQLTEIQMIHLCKILGKRTFEIEF